MATLVTVSTEIPEEIRDAAKKRFELEGTTLEAAVGEFLRDHAGPPDSRQAMAAAAQDQDYDAWFRQQVQLALDDPAPDIPHEQVQAEMHQYIAAAKARRQQNGPAVETTRAR